VTALTEAIAVAPVVSEIDKHKEIEKLLLNERKQKAKHPEMLLLLLGPGGSGKSTVVKQIKILTCDGFTPQEKEFYKHLCCKNIIENMKELLAINKLLDIELSPETQVVAARFLEWTEGLSKIEWDTLGVPPDVVADVRTLWADPVLHLTTMPRAEQLHIGVSASYFFNAVDRITEKDYVPTSDDILRSRFITTAVHETHFSVNDTKFRIIDVGGQRGERKKWIPLFSDVTAIIFVAAISEYDQKLIEDNRVNRLKESLDVFGNICNTKALRKTPIILMLNKVDLFKEKIKRVPLTECFREYTGDDSYDATSQYILDTFHKLKRNQTRTIYSHFTCATDTQSFKLVLTAVTDIIVSSMLDEQF